MFNARHLQEKWAPVLEHSEAPSIKDNYRQAVTAVLLENQERALREERAILNETTPVNSFTGSAALAGASGAALSSAANNATGLAGFDPILISLVRRSMPNLMAYDACGVQPAEEFLAPRTKPLLSHKRVRYPRLNEGIG